MLESIKIIYSINYKIISDTYLNEVNWRQPFGGNPINYKII